MTEAASTQAARQRCEFCGATFDDIHRHREFDCLDIRYTDDVQFRVPARFAVAVDRDDHRSISSLVRAAIRQGPPAGRDGDVEQTDGRLCARIESEALQPFEAAVEADEFEGEDHAYRAALAAYLEGLE